MTRLADLKSAIAPAITRYIELKRAVGQGAERLQYVLGQLDRFLAALDAEDLTSTTFSAWCSSIQRLGTSSRLQHMRVVYRFCLFRRRDEPGYFVPDPDQFPRARPRPRPHIFSEEEIVRILLTTNDLNPHPGSPLHRQVARLAVVLLYTTGLRREELVRLTLGDYDAVARVLHVRETKFHKSRLAPLSADAAVELDRYLEDRLAPSYQSGPEDALLLNRHSPGTGYTGTAMGSLLRKLFRAAGIRSSTTRAPRVHDLRFTFAVHALLRWYRAGVDVQSRLPALAAYMGHASVVSTQYYLTFLDAVAEAANDRFERHCSRFVRPPSLEGDQL